MNTDRHSNKPLQASFLITLYFFFHWRSHTLSLLLPQLGSTNLYSGITMPRQHSIPWWENRCWTGSSGAKQCRLPWYFRWTSQQLLWPKGGGPRHFFFPVSVGRGCFEALSTVQYKKKPYKNTEKINKLRNGLVSLNKNLPHIKRNSPLKLSIYTQFPTHNRPWRHTTPYYYHYYSTTLNFVFKLKREDNALVGFCVEFCKSVYC